MPVALINCLIPLFICWLLRSSVEHYFEWHMPQQRGEPLSGTITRLEQRLFSSRKHASQYPYCWFPFPLRPKQGIISISPTNLPSNNAHESSEENTEQLNKYIPRIEIIFIYFMSSCSDIANAFMFDYFLHGNSAFSRVPEQVIQFSGKTLGDLGFYEQCLDSGFNYALLHIQVLNLDDQFNYGLCLPPPCAAADLNQFDPFISEVINEEIGQQVVTSITFINPLSVNPQFDVLAAFVAVYILAIVLLSIVGSIYSLTNKYKPYSLGRFQFLKLFSFCDNWEKLFTIKEDGQFRVLNGIRAISISWVIYGHVYLILGLQAAQLANTLKELTKAGWLTLAPAAYFAVDVFFFVGGFLTLEIMLPKVQSMTKISSKFIPQLYLHRFLRLWPTYMTCLFFYWKLSVYLGSGPLWYLYIDVTGQCNQVFWQNMLLIDNLFPHVLDYCYGWGWYMANDFQIFLVVPPLLLLFRKSKILGEITLWLMLASSLITSYLICYFNDFHLNYPSPNAPAQDDYMSKYYYKPWVRCCPYFIGMILALHHKNPAIEKLYKSREWVKYVLTAVGLGTISFVIWIIVPVQADGQAWTQVEQYLYQTFGRVLFVFGLTLLILPSLYGIKEPIGEILSMNFFVPLARVSFCVYLVHFFVILLFTQQMQQQYVMQPLQYTFYSLTFVVFSFMAGAIVSLMVEVPIMNMLKPRSSKEEQNTQKPSKQNEQELGQELIQTEQGQEINQMEHDKEGKRTPEEG